MENLVFNLTGKVVRKKIDGRSYLVAPAVLLVPGVLNGSDGPGFYPADEISKNPKAWDKKPITRNHPMKDGVPVLATDPSVSQITLGFVDNTHINNDKLRAKLYFDEEKTREIDPRIVSSLEKNEPIELSTGLLLNKDFDVKEAEYAGKKYTFDFKTSDYRPDHVAILPDMLGACGVKDGCGVTLNAALSHSQLRERIWELLCDWHKEREEMEKEDGEEEDDSEESMTYMDVPYLIDVYDKYIIFGYEQKLWKLGYTTDLRNSDVSLSTDEPQEVRREVTYKLVSNSEGLTMNKGQLVEWITLNCDCWKNDKETLNNFSEEKLLKLKSTIEKSKQQEAVVNAAKKGFTDPGGNTHVWNEQTQTWETEIKKPAPTPVVNSESRLTPEEREDLDFARQEKMRQKAALVERLIVNVGDETKQQQRTWLLSKKLDELQMMAQLLPAPVVNQQQQTAPVYMGAAVAPWGTRNSAFNESDCLGLPQPDDYSAQASNRLKR